MIVTILYLSNLKLLVHSEFRDFLARIGLLVPYNKVQ